nr:hypothetical protein [Bacillus licheniformis]
MLKEPTRRRRMLFIGLESVGKTTLFSAITDQRAGEAKKCERIDDICG